MIEARRARLRAAGLATLDQGAMGRLLAHPRFAEAGRLWAAGAPKDPALADLTRDMGRFACGVWALALHASPGGLTLTRLTEVLQGGNVSGERRARAMILFMQLIGYIVSVPSRGDGRLKQFAPTARMTTAFRNYVRYELEWAGLLEPDCATVAARLDEPAVFDAYMRIFGEGMAIFYQDYDAAGDTMEPISHRTAGLLILGRLAISGEDDSFPPEGPVQVSAAALAKRYAVSRQHVMRLLRDWERAGLIERLGDAEYLFTPHLRSETARLVAFMGMTSGIAARLALEDIEQNTLADAEA